MTNILNLNTVRARITARVAIIGFSAEPIDPQRDKYNTSIFISECRDVFAARKDLRAEQTSLTSLPMIYTFFSLPDPARHPLAVIHPASHPSKP